VDEEGGTETFLEFIPEQVRESFQELLGKELARREEARTLRRRLKALEEGVSSEQEEHEKVLEEYRELVGQMRFEHTQLLHINSALRSEIAHLSPENPLLEQG
jgi:hypothetical protein